MDWWGLGWQVTGLGLMIWGVKSHDDDHGIRMVLLGLLLCAVVFLHFMIWHDSFGMMVVIVSLWAMFAGGITSVFED